MVVTPAEVAADHAGLLFGARRGRCRRGRSSSAPGNAPRSGSLASSAVIGTPQLDRVRPCEQGDAPHAQATTEHPPCSPTGGRGPSWCAGATAVVLALPAAVAKADQPVSVYDRRLGRDSDSGARRANLRLPGGRASLGESAAMP